VAPFHSLCEERYESFINNWIPPTVAVGSLWILENIVLVDCVKKLDRIFTKIAHHAVEFGSRIAFRRLMTGFLR
jgi:hypothetical protein